MKQVLTKFLILGGIVLLMLSACKKDGAVVTSNGGKPGALTASTTTPVLDKSKLADTTKVINFTFTSANYGFNAAVTNTLQIDSAGDNWVKPISVTLGTKVYSQGYSTNDFNSLLLKLNLKGGVTSQINVRVEHSVSTSVTPVYSNVLSLTVTPYSLVNVSYVYVPGAYQTPAPNWTPGTADSLQSLTSNGVYTGVINFKGATDYTFKVTSNKAGSTWYGNLNGAVSSSGSAGNFVFTDLATVDPAVKIMSDLIVFDLNKNTITLAPTLWSVVGDGSPGGWPAVSGYQSDTDMKYNNSTQTWSVVVNLTAGGGIKFRKNHDWGVSYGSVTTAGVLDQASNNNIAITATGTYLVTINMNNLTYTLVKQ